MEKVAKIAAACARGLGPCHVGPSFFVRYRIRLHMVYSRRRAAHHAMAS